tara:strand:- start:292 stop:1191 length:900 start_codon:yes stop_codon:yes gene_type:complete
MEQTRSHSQTPEQIVADFALLLDLEMRGADRFMGRCMDGDVGRIFGGQAIAQALVAARRTVGPEFLTHSLHAYFLRGGIANQKIEFRVKRDLDGRSFSNRRVVASQNGEAILNLTASFQKLQPGLGHQQAQMPDVPPPEDLVPDTVIMRKLATGLDNERLREVRLRPQPFDIRSVEPRDWFNPQKREALSHIWIRTLAPLPPNPHVHRAALAYVTDFQLLSTVLQPHGLSLMNGDLKLASLDHAVWYHEDFRCDDWLLYVTDSPWTGNARGFARGQVFDRSGNIVASVAQEGMIRDIRD